VGCKGGDRKHHDASIVANAAEEKSCLGTKLC